MTTLMINGNTGLIEIQLHIIMLKLTRLAAAKSQ